MSLRIAYLAIVRSYPDLGFALRKAKRVSIMIYLSYNNRIVPEISFPQNPGAFRRSRNLFRNSDEAKHIAAVSRILYPAEAERQSSVYATRTRD